MTASELESVANETALELVQVRAKLPDGADGASTPPSEVLGLVERKFRLERLRHHVAELLADRASPAAW